FSCSFSTPCGSWPAGTLHRSPWAKGIAIVPSHSRRGNSPPFALPSRGRYLVGESWAGQSWARESWARPAPRSFALLAAAWRGWGGEVISRSELRGRPKEGRQGKTLAGAIAPITWLSGLLQDVPLSGAQH